MNLVHSRPPRFFSMTSIIWLIWRPPSPTSTVLAFWGFDNLRWDLNMWLCSGFARSWLCLSQKIETNQMPLFSQHQTSSLVGHPHQVSARGSFTLAFVKPLARSVSSTWTIIHPPYHLIAARLAPLAPLTDVKTFLEILRVVELIKLFLAATRMSHHSFIFQQFIHRYDKLALQR
jgi:hypothetical protein